MDGFIGILGVVALLLGAGVVLGALLPGRMSLPWLLAAALLVLLNDLMLTNGYGLFPSLPLGSDWNWQGKILAFINGKHVTYTGGVDIDVSGWSRTLCVGLAMTAHNNSRLCPAFVSDVTFDIVQPKGTVLFMR